MYKLYLMINKINGKQYVGYTKQDIKQYMRFRKYDAITKQKNPTRALYRAIKKYGWAAFDWVELLYCEELSDAKQFEIQLIKEYDSYVPNGYNMTRGGDGGSITTEQKREKCRQARAKQIFTEEDKRKRSENKKRYFKENPRSQETVKKWRKSIKEYYKNNPKTDEDMANTWNGYQKYRKDKKRLSETKKKLKNVWASYTEEEKRERIQKMLKTRKKRHGY